MKTTIDLPEQLVARSKLIAINRKTTLKNLVVEGLEAVLAKSAESVDTGDAIKRLREGFDFNGKHLTRDESHER